MNNEDEIRNTQERMSQFYRYLMGSFGIPEKILHGHDWTEYANIKRGDIIFRDGNVIHVKFTEDG